MGQSAKFGVRVWPIWQDWGQLTKLYDRAGAMGFIANMGGVAAFAPATRTRPICSPSMPASMR